MPHHIRMSPHAARIATLLLSTTLASVGPGLPAIAAVPAGTELRVSIPERTVTRVERAAVAGERFRAGANDTFEILLADGGSVALAPGSVLVIDQFSFDPASGAGSMRMTLEQGSVRIMGGLLNQKAPILLEAGSAELSLTNGGAFVARSASGLRASLLVAGTLEVRGEGRTQVLVRPGYETVMTEGQPPSSPRRQVQGQAFADAASINPGLRSGGTARVRDGDAIEMIDTAQDESLDDPNLRRTEVALNPITDFAVSLPDGSMLAALAPPAGTLASLGVSGLSNSGIDVVLGQDRLGALLPILEQNPDNPDGAPFVFFNRLSGSRNIGLTTNRISSNGILEYSAYTDSASQLLAPIQYSDICCYFPPSSTVSYYVDTTLVTAAPLNRDTVFALSTPQALANQLGMNPFLSSTLQAYALAVPFDLIFQSSNELHLGFLNRPITIGAGGVGTGLGRNPVPGRSQAFNSFDQSGAINVRVNALTAGFLPFDQFLDLQHVNMDDGSIGLLTNPRSRDNFVMTEVQDSYGQRIIFAAGDVSNDRNLTDLSTIDSFVLTRGLNANDFAAVGALPALNAQSDFRGLLPTPSNFVGSLDLIASTPLLVYNPGGAGNMVSPFYMADLALSPEGLSSSTSATLGHITYQADGLDDGRSLVTLNGQTIGSTLTPTEGATLFASRLIATAVGGGGDWDASPAVYNRPGYASYLVLENVSNDAVLLQFPSTPTGRVADTILNRSSLADISIPDIYRYLAGLFNLTNQTDNPPGLADEFTSLPPQVQADIRNLEAQNLTLEQVQVLRQMPPAMPALTGLTGNHIQQLASGGTIAALGQPASNYGLLRLASGVQSEPVTGVTESARNAAAGSYHGYVAGLHQVAGVGNEGLYQGLISLGLNAGTGEVASTVTYLRPSASGGASPLEAAGTIYLGAAASSGGESAYIRPGSFGASVATPGGASAALIAGEAVKSGLGTANADKIKDYQHVQWGFFFGDLLMQGSARTHTALSTWAAGRRADSNERIQGTASYAGHAIGTAIRQGQINDVRTVVGTFEQTWNLDSRTGSMTLDFDGGRYQNGTGLQSASGRPGLAYSGVLNNAAELRQAKIDGELVDVQAMIPQGTAGQFQIRGIDASYQANGTFAGDVR